MPGDGGFSVERIDEMGVLQTAKWLKNRELTKDNQLVVGHEIFRVECESCHTTDLYRGVRKYLALRQWDQNKTQAMLGSLDLMHNGVMPPFAGTDSERDALAAFLSTIQPATPSTAGLADGKALFDRNCVMCHRVRPDDPLFLGLPKNPQEATNALRDLPNLFIRMPDLKLSDEERLAIVQWVNTQRDVPGASTTPEGGNRK
jgi:mono/diheme cytochrome c family protein